MCFTKNLVLYVLDDGIKPTAKCIHASANDIGNEKEIDDILLEMKMFIVLIKEKGIIPIISLPTLRADKYSQAINILNGRLVELCKTQGFHYIEHRDIRREHLNQGGYT